MLIDCLFVWLIDCWVDGLISRWTKEEEEDDDDDGDNDDDGYISGVFFSSSGQGRGAGVAGGW